MISRLTVLATAFAVLGTASLGYAASARQAAIDAPVVTAAAAKPMRIVQLQHVTVTAKRLDRAAP